MLARPSAHDLCTLDEMRAGGQYYNAQTRTYFYDLYKVRPRTNLERFNGLVRPLWGTPPVPIESARADAALRLSLLSYTSRETVTHAHTPYPYVTDNVCFAWLFPQVSI